MAELPSFESSSSACIYNVMVESQPPSATGAANIGPFSSSCPAANHPTLPNDHNECSICAMQSRHQHAITSPTLPAECYAVTSLKLEIEELKLELTQIKRRIERIESFLATPQGDARVPQSQLRTLSSWSHPQLTQEQLPKVCQQLHDLVPQVHPPVTLHRPQMPLNLSNPNSTPSLGACNNAINTKQALQPRASSLSAHLSGTASQGPECLSDATNASSVALEARGQVIKRCSIGGFQVSSRNSGVNVMKTALKSNRNEQGILIRKDGRPDRRSVTSARNLRGRSARAVGQRQVHHQTGPPLPSPVTFHQSRVRVVIP